MGRYVTVACHFGFSLMNFTIGILNAPDEVAEVDEVDACDTGPHHQMR